MTKQVTDNDYFVSLIQIALEKENNTGLLIRKLIKKNHNDRAVLLNSIIEDFKKNKIEPDLVEALEYLYDEDIVKKVKELLKD